MKNVKKCLLHSLVEVYGCEVKLTDVFDQCFRYIFIQLLKLVNKKKKKSTSDKTETIVISEKF